MVGDKIRATIKHRHINSSSKIKDISEESLKEAEDARLNGKRKSIHFMNEHEINQKFNIHSGQRSNYLAQSQSSQAEKDDGYGKGKASLRLSLQNVRPISSLPKVIIFISGSSGRRID